jgi:hypothetical protein
MPQHNAATSDDHLWGAKAIAQFIGRSVDVVYELADDEAAPVHKPGGRYYAAKSELRCWLRTNSPRKTPT